MTFYESLDKALFHLEGAVCSIYEAAAEMRKYRHPVDGELAGVMQHAIDKVARLKELKKWEEDKNESG